MTENKDKFTAKMFFKMWWPSTLSALPFSLGDTADTIILGQYIGTLGLTVICFCEPIFMLYNLIMLSLGLGGASQFSVFMGEDHIDAAKKCFNDTLKSGILIGIIVTALGWIFLDPLLDLIGGSSGDAVLYQKTKAYLKILLLVAPLLFSHYIIEAYLINDNRQGIANTGSLAASISSVLLTFIFVAVFDMGICGTAWAILTGQVIALLCYIPAFRSKESHLHFTDWKIDFAKVAAYFKSGFSVNISYLYQVIFLVVMNNVLIRTLGASGVAIFEIIQNVFYAYTNLWIGNAKAIQPLISTYVGEHYQAGIKLVKKLGILYSGTTAVLLAVAIMIFPSAVCCIFGYDDTESLANAYLALRIYAVSAVIASFYMCFINFYQAEGKAQRAILMNTVRGGISLLPCTVIFAFFFPEHIWFFYPTFEIAAVLIYLGLNFCFKKEKIVFDTNRVFVKIIENKMENMPAIADLLEKFGEKWGFSKSQSFFLRLGVEELVAIMLRYGFRNQEKGYVKITVIAEENGSATFHMRDTAGKFNPFDRETKKLCTNADANTDVNLLGIMVLKQKSKYYSYRYFQGFNALTMRF